MTPDPLAPCDLPAAHDAPDGMAARADGEGIEGTDVPVGHEPEADDLGKDPTLRKG